MPTYCRRNLRVILRLWRVSTNPLVENKNKQEVKITVTCHAAVGICKIIMAVLLMTLHYKPHIVILCFTMCEFTWSSPWTSSVAHRLISESGPTPRNCYPRIMTTTSVPDIPIDREVVFPLMAPICKISWDCGKAMAWCSSSGYGRWNLRLPFYHLYCQLEFIRSNVQRLVNEPLIKLLLG